LDETSRWSDFLPGFVVLVVLVVLKEVLWFLSLLKAGLYVRLKVALVLFLVRRRRVVSIRKSV